MATSSEKFNSESLNPKKKSSKRNEGTLLLPSSMELDRISSTPSLSSPTSQTEDQRLRRRWKTAYVKLAGIFLGASLWLAIGLYFRHPNGESSDGENFWKSDHPVGRARCADPFAEPGSLFRHPTDASLTNWIPIEPGCSPAPNYINMIRETLAGKGEGPGDKNFTELEFLRNRTIFIMGDSVDRNSIKHFCELISRPIKITSWRGTNDTGDFDLRGVPHLCQIEELDFKVVNGFHYGMDDVEIFNDLTRHPDWHAPGRFEDRLDELFSPYVKKYIPGTIRQPDIVVWSSGLWDVFFFGTEDQNKGKDFNAALVKERIEWWMNRARETIRKTREHFPDSLLVMRMMHRVSQHDIEPGWMQDVRIHQVREAQVLISRESKFFKTLDFGKVFEGYQKFQDKVHPLKNPGSIIFQAYLHYLNLAVQNRLI